MSKSGIKDCKYTDCCFRKPSLSVTKALGTVHCTALGSSILFYLNLSYSLTLLDGGRLPCWLTMVKNLPAMQETCLGQEDPLEGMETHSSILAWRIPSTEEPGGLQSMGLQRVGYD